MEFSTSKSEDPWAILNINHDETAREAAPVKDDEVQLGKHEILCLLIIPPRIYGIWISYDTPYAIFIGTCLWIFIDQQLLHWELRCP